MRPLGAVRRDEQSSDVRSGFRDFRGLSSNQVGQWRDLVQVVYAILKISPEGHTQLSAGRLQAEEGVPACRPASLRVPALIFRFFTYCRMSFSDGLLCSGICGRSRASSNPDFLS